MANASAQEQTATKCTGLLTQHRYLQLAKDDSLYDFAWPCVSVLSIRFLLSCAVALFFFLFGACSDITGNTVNQREAAVHSERLDRVCGAMEIVSFSFFLFFSFSPFSFYQWRKVVTWVDSSHIFFFLSYSLSFSFHLVSFLSPPRAIFFLSFFSSSFIWAFCYRFFFFSFLSLMRNTESSGSKSQKCYGNL